jgi:hypothetical protein
VAWAKGATEKPVLVAWFCMASQLRLCQAARKGQQAPVEIVAKVGSLHPPIVQYDARWCQVPWQAWHETSSVAPVHYEDPMAFTSKDVRDTILYYISFLQRTINYRKNYKPGKNYKKPGFLFMKNIR